MQNLKDKVKEVVNSFLKKMELFTALDVSNEVKKDFPLARHAEVREHVRDMYAKMQLEGYSKTPIDVNLEDGSVREAILYHHLSDAWDLDVKYDTQKRSQKASVSNVLKSSFNYSLHNVSSASNAPLTVNIPVASVVSTPVQISDPKQLWANLFTGVKLFPRS